ncbi:hypothetical protein N0B16_05805 [Chryseobacterium sp. GMJ5]|uniref:Ion channel n=1 Tax=Chryseobacterium gilvum TaxID=2976534 RepID=A0ABT2VVB7_9FLAO|nr:hypothetical protein [Chryseobacterium gilvum]MCU7613945.1 hypothetical protein [Chryseobacterium gilvum]
MKKKLEKSKATVVTLILPILMYLLYKSLGTLSNFEFYLYLAFFYYFILMSVMSLIIEFFEKIYVVNEEKPKYHLISEVLKFIFLISILFSTNYWIINDNNSSNFLNVTKGNKFEIFLDFFFYSLTTFIMNNSSEIKPNTIIAKAVVLTQIIASFTTLVLFLSQHKEFGNIIKQIEDRINRK